MRSLIPHHKMVTKSDLDIFDSIWFLINWHQFFLAVSKVFLVPLLTNY